MHYISPIILRSEAVQITPQGWRMAAKPLTCWYKRILADFCYNMLIKLKATEEFHYEEQNYRFEYYAEKEITELLSQEITSILYDLKNIESYALVIGQKEYFELVNSKVLNAADLTIHTKIVSHSGYKGTIWNIPIHVVSTLSGHALIPKVFIEKEFKYAEV